jgi:predicted PurR-regulated permease PerM
MVESTVPQPRGDEPLLEAELAAARMSSPERPLGPPGRAVDRRSPFYVGMLAAAGAFVSVAVVYLIVMAADALVLVGLGLFIAIGLQPAVAWLTRHRVPYALAVTVVAGSIVLLLAGFAFAAITPLVNESRQIVAYVHSLDDPSSPLGRLNRQFGVVEHLKAMVGSPSEVVSGLLVVLVLSMYFLADMPRIRRGLYRLVPASRRPRTILIGDQIFDKVAAYLLGNALISLIAGSATFVWLTVFGVPYALLLAIIVAVLDLVPVVGSVIAGAMVALMALTVSTTVCLATVGFFVAYKLVEDYVLLPRIIGRTVAIPAFVTVVSVLLGGVLLGVPGALVSIPLAAAALLVVREVVVPRLDRE